MLLENNIDNLGMKIIDFSLKGTDERIHSISDYSNTEILVLIFMCNHCPYVKAVIKRFISLQNHFSGRNVQFIGINPNDAESYPEDSFENMKVFYDENGMNFPYLADDTQETARKYNAVCTPDIFVFDKNRILKYRGRLDDNWKDESQIKSTDLKNAIEDILMAHDTETIQIPSMGCSIKWKNS